MMTFPNLYPIQLFLNVAILLCTWPTYLYLTKYNCIFY